MGVTSDWERDIKIERVSDTVQTCMQALLDSRIKAINEIRRQENKVESVCYSLGEYHFAMLEHRQAVNRFIKLNPCFDDMKGGAALLGSLERLESKIYNCTAMLKRYKADLNQDRELSNNQLCVFD